MTDVSDYMKDRVKLCPHIITNLKPSPAYGDLEAYVYLYCNACKQDFEFSVQIAL